MKKLFKQNQKTKISFCYKIILTLFLILLSSCAAIFSPSQQDVVISTNLESNIIVDSIYSSKNLSTKLTLQNDYKSKQIIIRNELYKDYYTIIFPNNNSKWHIGSYVPLTLYYTLVMILDIESKGAAAFVGVPLFIPVIVDNASRILVYKDSYSFELPINYKLEKREFNEKFLSISNVAIGANKENSKLINWRNYYEYLDYKYSEFLDFTYLDSLGEESLIYNNNLNAMLKKNGYIDTINNVFMDNLNTLSLNSKVIGYTINKGKFSQHSSSKFLNYTLNTEWICKNNYGDSLRIDTISTESGDFSVEFYGERETNKKVINDALELSLLEEIRILRKEGLLNQESADLKFEKMIIKKPTKIPNSINNSLFATVSIKHNEGHGSGFFISNDGYIITNHHVVNKKSEVKVILSDGKEVSAKVIRSNKVIDLALLKIEGENEYSFEIPFEPNYSVGDAAFAIGTPTSIKLGQSVAKGIVSGKRKFKSLNFLQTDININEGNSGGPIVNNQGKIIGVVEYKITGVGIEGLSFGIPAFEILEALALKIE